MTSEEKQRSAGHSDDGGEKGIKKERVKARTLGKLIRRKRPKKKSKRLGGGGGRKGRARVKDVN